MRYIKKGSFMINKITKRIFFILLLTVFFPALSYTQQLAIRAIIPYASSEEYNSDILYNEYNEQYYIDGDNDVTLETFVYAIPAEDGDWIAVQPEEIDPDGFANSDEEVFDDNINTGYIWRPNNMERNWNPYTNGYWEYTDW